MASQTLRPHRSPSPVPSPATPTMSSSNAAKLTRQSLGPPPTSSGAAKGFGGLGVSSPTTSQPRHVSTGGAIHNNGNHRDSFGSRPSLGNTPRGAPSGGGRPSSEFLPGFRDTKTPEAEQIDQWFKHLASWEQTLEEMAAASTDQNFTEELGAIEQWFRVLSEAERTAALYSLLQHSTPIQIRFFTSVLQHMSQADPLSAILSPNPNSAAGFAAQMDKLSTFKSPSAGGGNGYTGSPQPTPTQSQYLNPDDAQRAKMRQNRISAPGTLQPHDRWQGQQLDQVLERGPSPDNHSSRSRSPSGDNRPKSEAYAAARGNYNQQQQQQQERSPRPSGVGLGLEAPISPLLNNPSWASMVNTPLAPAFHDGKPEGLQSALNMANMQLAASKVALDDARKYRRPAAGGIGPSSRNVSGQSEESVYNGRATSPLLSQYSQYSRSPALDQYGGLGLGDTSALAGLGMNLTQLGLNPLAATQAQAQMLALAQAQQQLGQNQAYASAGFQGQGGYTSSRPGNGGGGMGGRPSQTQTQGRRSPMPGNRHSPTPQAAAPAGAGGGAGGGAGVAGPDDVDPKVIEDTAGWLRVLRLHKYTTTFEKTPWKTLVMMTDADLQDQGVAAQGARTKFLKVFHNVRTHLEIPHPPGQEEFAQKADGKA